MTATAGVVCTPLRGAECWYCGWPTHYAELRPCGAIRNVHVFLDHGPAARYTWCWWPNHRPAAGTPDPPLTIPVAVEQAVEATLERRRGQR